MLERPSSPPPAGASRSGDDETPDLGARIEALERALWTYRQAFEVSPVGMAITTPEGRFIDINASGLRLFEMSKEQVIGRTSIELGLIDPDDQDTRETLALRVRERGSVSNVHRTVRPKSGEIRDVALLVDQFELKGEPIFVSTFLDVTDRKWADEKLARSEERSRSLASQLQSVAQASQAVSEAVAALPESSLDAVLQTIALQARALTGAEYAAVGIGSDPEAPFDPWVFVGFDVELAARIGRNPRPVGVLGAVATENRALRHRDLRRHPASIGLPPHHPELSSFLGVPIRHGGQNVGNLYLSNKRGAEEFSEGDEALVQMLAARAATALKTAQILRAEGMERAWLESVIEQMPEGVVLMDADGRVRAQNRFITSLSRAEAQEVDPFGNPVSFEMLRPSGEPVPLQDRPNVRALLSQESVAGEEFLISTGDGRTLPVLVCAAPVHGGGGEITGATMIVQDVSELKRLERLREEWASLIAHDLRHPLGMIRLSIGLVDRSERSETELKAIDRIEGAVQRMGRMIDDLLDISCIEANRLALDRRRVDLSRSVQEVVERMPHVSSRCRIEARADGGAVVWADPGRIEQVLTNLLSNASKYGESDREIRVEVLRRPLEAEVIVTNCGRGIQPDELESIFSRFERGRDARSGQASGLGLGLYISRGLVEAHGGHIWAESTPEVTTSFHFTLPLLLEDGQSGERAGSN